MAACVSSAARAITDHTGLAPRVNELAEYLEVNVEDVLAGLDAANAHYSLSLDAPVLNADGEDSASLGDLLGDEDERFGLVETKLSLSAAISQLPHDEREALRLRIDQNMKQVDIARRMGCSQMQVSRLLRRAGQRLRELTDPDLTPTDNASEPGRRAARSS